MSQLITGANPGAGPETTMFVRKATGLVRSWSPFDAFIYATFSINLITLGLYIFSQMYALQGGLIPTLLISAFFILFEILVYASLIAVMPRAGGDYVWQSRILGSGVGFVLSVTGWWFILWLWVPLYGDMLRHIFFTPLLGIMGYGALALLFSQTGAGIFISSLIVCLLVTFYITVGMRWYARVQSVCFWLGMVGLAVVFGLLLFGDQAAFRAGLDREAVAMFGAQASGIYEATLAAGTEAGAIIPLSGGNVGAIFLAMPFLVFFNLWPTWGATLYGEVRGASDFKRNFWGMAGALVITTILAIVFLLLINKTIGWDFYIKANAAWWNYTWELSDQPPPLPIWPYPVLLAVFLTSNKVVQFLVVLAMSAWWFGWSGTVFLSSTRVIFAVAFDRLLPERVAEIDPYTRTPIYALLLMVLPSIIVSALFAWNVFGFRSLTLDSTLVIAVTFLGTSVAATVLPYVKPEMYNASPIAHYRVAGIPLITIAGAIFSSFLLFLLYQWLIDPFGLYGISYRNTASLRFILFLYGLAFAIYFGFRFYRKREGIDIEKIYQEIPVE